MLSFIWTIFASVSSKASLFRYYWRRLNWKPEQKSRLCQERLQKFWKEIIRIFVCESYPCRKQARWRLVWSDRWRLIPNLDPTLSTIEKMTSRVRKVLQCRSFDRALLLYEISFRNCNPWKPTEVCKWEVRLQNSKASKFHLPWIYASFDFKS